ncbi:S-layer homology domain-containing protein [Microbacterium suwonense]|uniref:S-layer homology domain-containing protein n=2 Tax=Microbacterium suwonense TaxID=683047 RepID=UPI002573AE8A|nr:S-layer homology domain-containing protein [Microbacterium suwonense]
MADLPLTISSSTPPSLYATPHQWTISNVVAGQRSPFNAMGFRPGETVRVSFVMPDDATFTAHLPAPPTVVTADGAGGISGTALVPPDWTGDELVLVAAGATSRYVLISWMDQDDISESDVTLTASVVEKSSAPSGRAVQIQLTGDDANASVIVALHSAEEPIVLGSLTTNAAGASSATLVLPPGLAGDYSLWTGTKTGGYRLTSTLISLGASPAQAVSFSDVSGSPGSAKFSEFAVEIAWMAQSGISTGYDVAGGKKEYRPFGTVTRDAMAAFLYRAAGSPAFNAPAKSPFTDVTPSSPFYKEITWLASTGVTTGWELPGGKKEYRPFSNITRDAMAAFLYRFADSPSFTAPARSAFIDVATKQSFYKEIAWLSSTGVSGGWTTGKGKEFRPYNAITRDAMAAFLYRYDHLN